MRFLVALLFLGCAGCASYLTPGGPVSLTDIDRSDTVDLASRRPSPHFPASIAVVRVQAPAYRSYSATGVGAGRYCVVTAAELITPETLGLLAAWPAVAALDSLDPDPVPPRYDSLDDLRLAAAKAQADVLMVYTVDTAFTLGGHAYAPLSEISLKTPPDPDAHVTSTATALFVDVRTGFVYGTADATAKASGVAGAFPSAEAVDAQRRDAERQAFAGLLVSARKTWGDIVDRYR